MGRRYLTRDEAQAALNRGKAVECLVGRCERAGVIGIRYVQIRGKAVGPMQLFVYESVDRGHFDDEAGPLNPELDLGDAAEVHSFVDLDAALTFLDGRWAGASEKLVNEFMLAEEYLDRLQGHSR